MPGSREGTFKSTGKRSKASSNSQNFKMGVVCSTVGGREDGPRQDGKLLTLPPPAPSAASRGLLWHSF